MEPAVAAVTGEMAQERTGRGFNSWSWWPELVSTPHPEPDIESSLTRKHVMKPPPLLGDSSEKEKLAGPPQLPACEGKSDTDGSS